MQQQPAGIDRLKQGMRHTWMSGDFGQVAQFLQEAADDFVTRLAIPKGASVLDVACGSGNLSIPAARGGARVTGVDIAPNLVEQAQQRAAAEGLDAKFEEGDAEALPYGDAEFDIVMTMFGAMFAPRPDVTASELIRVCKPGGTVAMANWTPGGFVERMFGIGAKFIPPPDGIPSPLLWGDETIVRQRLATGTSEIRTTVRTIELNFPFSPYEVTQHFRKYFGPVHVAFSRLDASDQPKYMGELEKLWTDLNQASDGRTLVKADYLEVIATKASAR